MIDIKYIICCIKNKKYRIFSINACIAKHKNKVKDFRFCL